MEIYLLARHELARLFTTRRGLFALAAFLAVWLLLLLLVMDPAVRLVNGVGGDSVFEQLIDALAQFRDGVWPRLDLVPYWLTGLYLFPAFVIVFAADQTASDRSRGTLRYVSLRASRSSIFFGRFLAQLLVLVAMLLFTSLCLLIVFALHVPDELTAVVAELPLLLLNLLVVLMPFVALMSLLSVIAASGRQAIWLSVLVWVASVLLAWQLGRLAGAWPIADYLFPGSQTRELLRRDGVTALQLAWIPALQTIVFATLGYALFHRRDL